MSPPGCQKMSATPCNRNAEESFPVLSLKSREQEPPNPLLIRDKAFYSLGPGYTPGWEPDSILYGAYAPDTLRNIGHVNDPTLTAMLKAQRRTKDLEARKQLIFAIQRYEADQQYYINLACLTMTGSHQPYVKNYAPNALEEYGMAAAVLWLER